MTWAADLREQQPFYVSARIARLVCIQPDPNSLLLLQAPPQELSRWSTTTVIIALSHIPVITSPTGRIGGEGSTVSSWFGVSNGVL